MTNNRTNIFTRVINSLTIRYKLYYEIVWSIFWTPIETLLFHITKKEQRIALNGYQRFRCGKMRNLNLGDDLNYHILKELSGRKVFNWNLLINRQKIECFMAIGSLLQRQANKANRAIVWGTGAMFNDMPFTIENAEILAVRGKYTYKLAIEQGFECQPVLGDPALLLPNIYRPAKEKKYKFGIIPHGYDQSSNSLAHLKDLLNENYIIIDIVDYKDWHHVIDLICSCDQILSSSLHGLIISDAYGIPNAWIKLSEKVEGNGFKFLDYFSSVDRDDNEPLIINEYLAIDDIKAKLANWEPINYNPYKLLEVFPFK